MNSNRLFDNSKPFPLYVINLESVFCHYPVTMRLDINYALNYSFDIVSTQKRIEKNVVGMAIGIIKNIYCFNGIFINMKIKQNLKDAVLVQETKVAKQFS